MNIFVRVVRKLKRDGLASTLMAIARYLLNFRHRMAYEKMLRKGSMQERFSSIYEDNLWRSDESGSGEGSELAYTENVRNWLVYAIPKYSIRTFVDAPCGDLNWMRTVLPKVDVDYLGLDIVESVIEKNRRAYGTERIKFGVANICEDRISKCDLLMVRDCLFHLSYGDINKFLKNLSNTDYKYLLTTTHTVDGDFSNSDIETGDFRLIDLFGHPFGFSKESAIETIEDYPLGYPTPRKMILIAKGDVPAELASASTPPAGSG